MSFGERWAKLGSLLSRLHLLAAVPALLFLGATLVQGMGRGFVVEADSYPRVRYRPGPAAEVVLQTWRAWGVQADQRIVVVLGLADAGAKRLDEDAPGLAVARHLAEAGATIRVVDERFTEDALPQDARRWERFAEAVQAAREATDILRNSDLERFDEPDFAALAAVMKGKAVFDCLETWDGEAVRGAGLNSLPVGGPGYPPWLDPEFQEFVQGMRETTPEDAAILLLPSERLASPSPRARWYLLLNYFLAPRKLFLPYPELASGTAPQYREWVRRMNERGAIRGPELGSMLEETGARSVLYFRHGPDFRHEDWRLVAVESP